MNIKKTKFFSKKVGKLPTGCKYCVKGEKLVLFITGLCPRKCYFCPVSDEKSYKDVIFANEKRINSEEQIDEIIKEAKMCNSKGAGITGGDPLSTLDRTCRYIKALKKEFENPKLPWKKFHIHLYTSLDLVNENSMKKLYNAGLDEIRFHLDLDNKKFWDRISIAGKYDWDVGIELPVVPTKEKELKEIILHAKNKITFMNLNELETSDNSINTLTKDGYYTKNNLSYGIKGSQELAEELLQFSIDNKANFNMHFCTAKLKDKIQLNNRIKRRSKKARSKFDKVTSEGLLIRGVIYLKDLEPGFGYNKKISEIKLSKNKDKTLKKLNTLKNRLVENKKLKLKHSDLVVDSKKLRVFTTSKIARKISKQIKNKCAIVTEYPTEDNFDVEIDFLN